RAEAMGIGVRRADAEHWKETQKMVRELANGPLGLAIASKMTDAPISEIKKLVGMDDETNKKSDVPPPKDGLRAELLRFGESLTDEQQFKLMAVVGLVPAAKLKEAATAADDDQARVKLVEAVVESKLAEKVEALAAFLTDEQGAML